jgi:hypothetical protein
MEIYTQELDAQGKPTGGLLRRIHPEDALARFQELKGLIASKNDLIASFVEEANKQRAEKELYVAERDELKLKLGKE